MRSSWTKFIGAVAAGCAGISGASAAQGGMLYAYEIDRGRNAQFEAGYKAHLAWHAEKDDALVWYGWMIVAGARTGAFIDGTFGAEFSAIDARPLPGEDGAHFAEFVAPFVSSAGTSAYELWREVSTAFPLEERAPSRMVDVYFLDVAPGEAGEFERRLLSMKKAGEGAPLTWYRAGPGAAGAHLVMAPRDGWANLDERGATFTDLIAAAYGARADDVAALMARISSIESEIWAYRVDLSYFPKAR